MQPLLGRAAIFEIAAQRKFDAREGDLVPRDVAFLVRAMANLQALSPDAERSSGACAHGMSCDLRGVQNVAWPQRSRSRRVFAPPQAISRAAALCSVSLNLGESQPAWSSSRAAARCPAGRAARALLYLGTQPTTTRGFT